MIYKQEINDLLKDFSSSKLLQLKQFFNVEINKKRGLYFVEQNGDKLSVAKFNRKNADKCCRRRKKCEERCCKLCRAFNIKEA